MVQAVVFTVLADQGSVLAALIGWIACSVVIDTAAALWPRRFRERTDRIYLQKFRRVQALERRRAKAAYNSRTPPRFGQACSDTSKMILEGGPDYFARNGIKPPRRHRRRRMTRKDTK